MLRSSYIKYSDGIVKFGRIYEIYSYQNTIIQLNNKKRNITDNQKNYKFVPKVNKYHLNRKISNYLY